MYDVFLGRNDCRVNIRYVVDCSKNEIDKDETSAPIITTDALYITFLIGASKERCLITWVIPRAILQTAANPSKYIKITGK